MQLRWPFSLLIGATLNTRSKAYVDELTPHGYAVVSVDVRGTGASGGARPLGDLLPPEVDDMVAVLNDWAKH